MGRKKKLLTSVIALGTAAALTLGGTFAWQSISQKAINEASDIVNPGGRLHNDQHWVSAKANDTNIYVENFTDPENGGNDIYARVRLSEYMEIVMNYGIEGAETVEVVAGSKTAKADSTYSNDDATHQNEFEYEYAVHYFGADAENGTDDWWQWTTGETTEDSEETYFMPTFNKNKDSLLADLNGEYVDTLGGISNRKAEQYTYTAYDADTEAVTANAVYDGDTNTLDEVTRTDLLDLIENGTGAENYSTYEKNIALVEETHAVATVGETKGLISLTEWLEKAETEGYKDADGKLTETGEENLYGYWVYDTDGWVYWSAPIAAGTTTGLLLDGIELKQVMDDTWYYAIEVESQFVTANDVGKADNTGFYSDIDAIALIDETDEDTTETTLPVSKDAETLLKLIGVEIPEDSTSGDNSGDDSTDTGKSYTLKMAKSNSATSSFLTVSQGDKVNLQDENGDAMTGYIFDMSLLQTSGTDTLDDSKYVAFENGVLEFKTSDLKAGNVVAISIGDYLAYFLMDTDSTLTLRGGVQNYDEYIEEVADGVMTSVNGEVEVQLADGTHPGSLTVKERSTPFTTLTKDTDYTYDSSTGILKITSATYEGKVLKVSNADESEEETGVMEQCGVLLISASSDGGNSSAGGGQNEDDTVDPIFYAVTDNDGDDTNNPAVTYSDGEWKVSYTGTATEFTFAPVNSDETNWDYCLTLDDCVGNGAESTMVFTRNDGQEKVATFNEKTGVLTLEKSVSISGSLKAGDGTESHTITLNLTNTSDAD